MTGWESAGQVSGAQDGAEAWECLLAENPRVLWGLVADVVKAVKAGEGERKTGRRPAVAVRSLDELYALLFPPTFEQRPFPEAFAVALGTRSQRAFALHSGFNQGTVSRLLAGKLTPTVDMIERIAAALNVRPTYFHEYRALKLGEIITAVLLANPQLSAEAARRLVGVPA